MERSEKIAVLIYKHLSKSITEEEQRLLVKWIDERKANENFFIELADEDFLRAEYTEFQRLKEKFPPDLIFEKLSRHTAERKKIPLARWLRIAALVAGIILFVTMIMVINPSEKNSGTATVPDSNATDLPPGTDRAILTLADGRNIELDSAANPSIPDQGNTYLVKKGKSELSYSEIKTFRPKEDELYNVISTPKGGRYRVVLPDGTKVWLNSASSLRFSPSFFHKKRIVTISGEAYFEVVKKQHLPFTVLAGDMSVEVLGTSFNVMAYTDEQAIRTTLVEGRIRLRSSMQTTYLNAGQECVVKPNGSLLIQREINVEKTLAWKNGMFNFNREKLETIMKQVSRWYNVEVVFRDPIAGHFVATINRNVPVSELLKMLEMTGGVHFEIKPDTIFVTRK
jgi:transmembrane sensor